MSAISKQSNKSSFQQYTLLSQDFCKRERFVVFLCTFQITIVNFILTEFTKKIQKFPIVISKGPVHILGKNYPRSDPHIAHMGYLVRPSHV